MKSQRVLFLVLSAILCISLIVPAVESAEEPAPPPLKSLYRVGDDFPPISLADLEGKKVLVSSMLTSEKNYIVFFNTACMNCQLEMSIFQKNIDSAKKKGIGVIAIGIDMGGPDVLKVFQAKRKYPFPILSDKDFELAGKLGLSFTPATIVVDKAKKIVDVAPGFDNEKAAKLEAALK